MPVGLSPAVASTIKTQIGCNIRQLPQFVNVSFPDKSRQPRRGYAVAERHSEAGLRAVSQTDQARL
jgi:hypothetical protein